jgi:hypothetical protein
MRAAIGGMRMTDDFAALSGGAGLGMGGLANAIERLHEANANLLRGGGGEPIARALGEALFWIAALDHFFAEQQGYQAYWASRASDARGRTVGGLIFARNVLGHGLHIAGAIRFTAHPPTVVKDGDNLTIQWARLPGREYGSPDRGTVLSIQMAWADLEQLPTPSGPQWDRDVWYRDLVAAQPLSGPLKTASEWFRAQP